MRPLRFRMTKVLLVVGLVVVLKPVSGLESAPESSSINAEDLRRDVFILASDEAEGRLVGTPGNQQAAEFIVSRFEALGLKKVEGNGYWHAFDLIVPRLGTNSSLDVTVGKETATSNLGNDFYPERFSGTARSEGSLVFVGFGISVPNLGHDDYRDADVTDKVVVVLDHEPGERDPKSLFAGEALSEHGRSVRKALEAQRRGAGAVLLLSDIHNHSTTLPLSTRMNNVWPAEPRRIPRYQLGAWVSELRIPVIRISVGQAERLLTKDGEPLDALTRLADAPGGITPVERPDVSVAVTSTVHRDVIPEHNVVGLIEGSDPTLRDEWIILCAHYDHEGRTTRGIFNGADDNASGVAGLLEIAEAYALAAHQGQHPKRSILFAAWNAEERGMLGAWAYTERPLAPLSQTVAVINMDMIGRNEEVPENGGHRFRGLEPQTAESNADAVNLLGYSYSADLRRATEMANDDTRLQLRFRYDKNRSNLLRRSDHWPFLFRRVPALFVHTGLHPDYHTERDRPETLDYYKMSRVVRLVYQLSWNLATDPMRPAFD